MVTISNIRVHNMFDNLWMLLIRFVTHIRTRNGLAFIRILLIQFNSMPFSEVLFTDKSHENLDFEI